MPTIIADRDLVRQQCFVGGEWFGAGTAEVCNPATGEVIAHVPNLDTAAVRRAVEAAQHAGKRWSRTTAAHRARLLRRWYELVVAATDDLAQIITCEQGKPLGEARGEVAYAASFIEWFSEETKRTYGEIIPSHRSDARLLVVREPVGVVAAITPWNFPAAMVTRKLAPALAAGCTVVLKPAQETPLTALALADLAEQAGIPAGVLNVVTGDAETVAGELVTNPTVRKLTFTGSTRVGKLLMAQCAPTLKRLSLELGGNAPFIVFPDADLQAAVEGLVASKFRNCGQTCVSVNRVLVHRDVAAPFAALLVEAVRLLKMGPGSAPDAQLGPLISDRALAKVQAHVDDARAKGGQVLTGGRPHALGGLFFEPTVIADCTPDMLVATEETFGPLAALFSFADEAEAIALANQSDVGLAGYFYTRDNARAFRVAENLEVGMVGINTGMISTEVAPFGGIKESGFGREGSRHGIEDYMTLKYMCMAGIN